MALTSSISSDEYLYGIYHRFIDDDEHYEIWRWELSDDWVPPEGPFRIPIDLADQTDTAAFVSIDSKIYMIGFGPCWNRILVVETNNLDTCDYDQIVSEVTSFSLASVRYRNAAAIGRKIYTFPHHFGPAQGLPLAWSRFQVFDPATGTTKSLPEPPVGFPPSESVETYLVLKTHILLCIKLYGRRLLFAFDTASEYGGWKDITSGFAINPFLHEEEWIGLITNPSPYFESFPFFPTGLDKLCATTLGGRGRDDDGSMRFFVTTESHGSPWGFAIAEIGYHPIRIQRLYKVLGIPNSMLGCSCFAHGGNVFFTFTYDDRPDSGSTAWEFQKFLLVFVEDEDGQGHYVAQSVFSSRLLIPIFDTLRASFVIRASI